MCFHFHRHLVTLFGYDTAQFRQCGIFIHNTEAVLVPPIEIKKKEHKFLKVYFYILVPSKNILVRFLKHFCIFCLFLCVSVRSLCLSQASKVLKQLAYFMEDIYIKTNKQKTLV